MEVIIMGAGRIGRGFVSELMKLNDVSVTLFDASQQMVDKLNEAGNYTIHICGHEELNVFIDSFRAFHTSDTDRLAECWKTASFIFTACGGKNMPAVGRVLAEAFVRLNDCQGVHVSNIVTCENWVDPATDLHKAIIENLPAELREVFEENTGVSEAVVLTTGTGAPEGYALENDCDTWVQNYLYLPIDVERLKGEIPKLRYLEFVDDFGTLLKQKLYTNNTSCGTVAYLGYQKGIRYLADACNDPEIAPIMDELYEEINAALIRGMGVDEAKQLAFSARAKAKYTDVSIVDPVTRIARDPLRKLAPEDRLVGPARIAMRAGVRPEAMALGCAAALYYDNPDDESAVRLQAMRREHGNEYILQKICGLSPDEEYYSMVLAAVDKLKQWGWIKDNRDEGEEQ